MPSGDFLLRIGPLVRARVPEDLADFHWDAVSFQAKLWYGNKDLHYEVWPRERLATIEIGLHFESDHLTNARLLAAFTANARAVCRTLPSARIEGWDRGWARVWEPLPHRQPDAALSGELADRIAAYVVALEPILRRELPNDVAWSDPLPRRRPVRVAARSRARR